MLAQWLGLDVRIRHRRRRAGSASPRAQADAGGDAAFALAAPAEVWAQFFAAVPPRHHHAFFAMLARVRSSRSAAISCRSGSSAMWCAACWRSAAGWRGARRAGTDVSHRPSPASRRRRCSGLCAGYRGRATFQVYYETAGTGRDLLCLHTAGSDGRQFHRLMGDPRLTARIGWWHSICPGTAIRRRQQAQHPAPGGYRRISMSS